MSARPVFYHTQVKLLQETCGRRDEHPVNTKVSALKSYRPQDFSVEWLMNSVLPGRGRDPPS